MTVLGRLAAVCVAILATWLGLGATPTDAVESAPVQVASYTYDGHQGSAEQMQAATERGPPAGNDSATTYDAVGHCAGGAAARPDGVSTVEANDYEDSARFGRVTHARDVVEARSDADPPDHLALPRLRVAAKSADEVADIGHAGLRHQFPNTLKGKSQFYDNVDLGGLASRTKGMDGFLQTNGNTRYVLRNPGGVGVDRTTGLPTDVFTVIRRPDGSVVTMFPGTSPKG